MATTIDRVRRAVAQTPWAILPEKLEQICEFLAARAEGRLSAGEIEAAIGDRRPKQRMQGGGVAVLPVYGTISQRMDMLSEMSGGTSTENLAAAFDRYMADPDISTVVLDIDSPGGTVPGVMELSDKIFEARGKGKRIVAVANSMAASAAYWIATAADELWVTPSGVVGSVGVYTIHQEGSRMFDEAGITTTIIKAGEHKAEGNPYEPLPEDARAYTQAQIDEIYGEFVGAVARNRGVTVAKVESDFGQGRVLKAKGAIAAGMADRVGTLEQVLAELGVSRMQRRDEARMDTTITSETISGDVTAALIPIEAAGIGTGVTRWVGVDQTPTVYRITGNPIQVETTDAPEAASEEAKHAPITEPAPEARETVMSKQTDVAAQNGAVEETATTDSAATVRVDVDFRAERERSKAITELCEMHGIRGEAADYIATGASVNEVVGKIRDRATENLSAMKASHVEMSEKEQRAYSINRAILAAADRTQGDAPKVDDGFEREVSEHIRERMPKDYKSRGGFFAPMAVLNTGTATAGGNTVFTQEGEFIDMLRARMKVAELGATILTGLEGGTLAFPKQTGAGSWTWVAENPGSDVALSDATVGQVLLAPKAGQSATSYTRQLLAQSSISVENFVRSDMSLAAALGIDLAAIEGNPSVDANAPRGILYTAGIGDVEGGANGAAPTYAHAVDLETAIAIDNADIGSMAYLSTPGVRGKLKKTEQFTSGEAVWTGGREGEVNGYPAHISTQVPSDLDKGTSTAVCHAIIFGVWSQLLIGYWGAMEVVVDPYTKKRQGLIEVSNFQIAGVAVRHAEAFAAMKDALVS
jgi:HK97 family phage major capsid protein